MTSKIGLDILFCSWLLLTAATFWGPFVGLPVPVEIGERGYVVLLVVSLLAATLATVRRNQKTDNQS
jgi:hypothetical protein